MADTPEPEQLVLTRQLVKLARIRNAMSAERSYMNAERTLSVWLRTALSLMVFGVAVDRLGVMFRQLPSAQVPAWQDPYRMSNLGGALLIGFGVVMAASAGWRFLSYARAWRRTQRVPLRHGPYLAGSYAALVVLLGVALLVVLQFVVG